MNVRPPDRPALGPMPVEVEQIERVRHERVVGLARKELLELAPHGSQLQRQRLRERH